MEQKIYIATVAEKGAGKGLFVEILRKLLPDRKVVMIRSSDPWREIAHVLGKEESRDNISTVATGLRAAFHDNGILIPALRKRIQTADADVIVLDGLRKPEELSLVRELNGIVLYIAANLKVRFERRSAKAETTDEEGMTWEQFMRQEQMAPETSIRSMGETMSDVRLENNGTVEEFEATIKRFLQRQHLL